MSKSVADIAREEKWTVGTLVLCPSVRKGADGLNELFVIAAIPPDPDEPGILLRCVRAWHNDGSPAARINATRAAVRIGGLCFPTLRKVGHVDECARCGHDREEHSYTGSGRCLWVNSVNEAPLGCLCPKFIETDIEALARTLAAEQACGECPHFQKARDSRHLGIPECATCQHGTPARTGSGGVPLPRGIAAEHEKETD